MLSRFTKLASLLGLAVLVRADLTIYTDGSLTSGWENWSWGSDVNFAATDLAVGSSSISVTSQAWSALSVKLEGVWGGSYAGIKFDVAGSSPDVTVYFTSTETSTDSAQIPLSAISKTINPTGFTTLLIDFNSLPPAGGVLGPGTWDRITFQGGANGATYHLDNIILVSEVVVTPLFLSAEPLLNNVIAVTTQGAVDFSKISVTLNKTAIAVSGRSTYSPPDTPSRSITYLTLAKPLARGTLNITAGSVFFAYTLPAVLYTSLTLGNTRAISPLVYGVNWPTDASYINTLGTTVGRWGGNAVSTYNPFGGFTNAGNDWFFENRASDGSADDWIGWVKATGSATAVTVPALDWVSKDTTSYSYPKTIYPDQSKFDPYNADAGSGVYPNGSYLQPPPDPNRAYTPWNTTLAAKWLTGLVHKPDIVFIDNEIEIASNTHQDAHPSPVGYDEELARVLNYSIAIKNALPSVKIAAPSTCGWWFYWTSSIGYTDNAAHGNVDFLPWFLTQMKAKDTALGKRLLDYLDVHYYFAADTSAGDAAANAIKLRATRSFWDPTYIDESWIGSSPQNHQPNPTAVWLIPRLQALIAQLYPGTKLSISEWAAPDNGVTGGLVTADVLGIFGRYGVDAATYWSEPDAQSGPGLAYWLYRGGKALFGSSSVQVSLSKESPNTLGVYAGTTSGKVSLVIINKDLVPQSFQLANLPAGTYVVKHFGGAAGVAKWTTKVTLTFDNTQYLVVPSYTAISIVQQ